MFPLRRFSASNSILNARLNSKSQLDFQPFKTGWEVARRLRRGAPFFCPNNHWKINKSKTLDLIGAHYPLQLPNVSFLRFSDQAYS